LAEKLGLEFVDADPEIEKSARKKIADIFRDEWEDGFRDWEEKTLQILDETYQDFILATGGGVVIRGHNRDILRSFDHVIYLRTSVDTLCRRLEGDIHRPLLQDGDPKQKLENLLVMRQHLYQAVASQTVETDTLAPEEVAGKVCENIEQKKDADFLDK